MIEIKVPGRDTYRVEHLVLDVNGTIVAKGDLIEGVAKRLAELSRSVEVHVVTADTRGRQHEIDAQLGIKATRIRPGDEAGQKASLVRSLGSEGVCAIGNGAIDAGMLREAKLAIVVLGEEGLAVEALNEADVVAPHINSALDLLLFPLRLVATLRR
jgi:P-type E1-E2 ATPase